MAFGERAVAARSESYGSETVYGGIRAALEKRGALVGPYDLQIAAHALALRLVRVSDNTGEFRRVKGLKVENWRRRR